MKLLAATHNKEKLRELERILSPLGIELTSPGELGVSIDVEETGETFAENARIKAQEYYHLTGLPSVADDSGLCVDALNGRPGVHSARYCGGAAQPVKTAALLDELKNVGTSARTARFVCAICCVLDEKRSFAVTGVCEGAIAAAPSGERGFGYDPIFLYEGKCFGEITGEEKDAVSHRGKALREFASRLKEEIGL